MNSIASIDERYLQVRRAVAAIAYQNLDIDEQERLMLASCIAGQYQLSEDQLHILAKDAIMRPDIEGLVNEIGDPSFVRLLLADLMVLAIFKEEWEGSEHEAAIRAINVLTLPESLTAKIRHAFESLMAIAKHFGNN